MGSSPIAGKKKDRFPKGAVLFLIKPAMGLEPERPPTKGRKSGQDGRERPRRRRVGSAHDVRDQSEVPSPRENHPRARD